jgi:hypothetical protein
MQVVEGILALLALPDPALLDGGGHFGHLVAVGDHANQQL